MAVDNCPDRPQKGLGYLGIPVWIAAPVCGLAQVRHLRMVDKWIGAVDNDRVLPPAIPPIPQVIHRKKFP